MAKICAWLRLPVFFLGMVLLFVADRYLGGETYQLALRITALLLVVLGLGMTFLLAVSAKGEGFAGEAAGWRRLCLWQLTVLVGLAVYIGYGKMLGASGAPETPLAKVLLGAWLVLLCLGFAAGIGGEWAMRTGGRGDNAEPARIGRASVAWLKIGMLFAFLVAINYVGARRDIQKDLSYLKIRSPSESTMKMVGTLTDDLQIAAFYPQGNEVKELVADYLSALAGKDKHVKVAWYDKDMDPTKAEEYRVSRNGEIVFAVKGKKSRIDTGTTLAKARKTLKQLDQQFQKSFLEITAARKTLYFTRGHGELSWVGDAADDPLRSLKLLEGFLREQNYSTRLFGVAEGSATAVPDDAAAVVIAGPKEPFQKEEVDALRTYVEHGGNLMVFLDTDKAGATPVVGGEEQPLYGLLAEMGLKYNEIPLANERNHVAATHSPSDMWFIFTNIFTSHASVMSLARHDERVALISYQGGYFTVTPNTAKWKAFETVRSLSDSFADLNRNFQYDKGEKRDAYVMGAVAELKNKKATGKAPKDDHLGRVLAFSDATAISDGLVRNIGNILYFSDGLKWLVGQPQISGELAVDEDVKIRHTRKEDVIWFQGTVVVVPLLVLGVGYLATRRKKRGASGDGKEKVVKDAA